TGEIHALRGVELNRAAELLDITSAQIGLLRLGGEDYVHPIAVARSIDLWAQARAIEELIAALELEEHVGELQPEPKLAELAQVAAPEQRQRDAGDEQ